jgi:PAS domain S-box-containing protein
VEKYLSIFPLQNLVTLTQKFARGYLQARSELTARPGEIGILIKAFHDMAESLTISKQTLQKSETKFRLLADHTHDCEYWIDPNGKFIYLSPSCERITGYSSKEIISDPQLVLKMVKPDYAEKVHQHYLNEKNKDAPIFSMEFPIITKDGKEAWLKHNGSPGSWNYKGSTPGAELSSIGFLEKSGLYNIALGAWQAGLPMIITMPSA